MSFGAVTLELLDASKYTLGLFALTLLAAIPLGVVICAGAMSKFKPIKWISNMFIWVVRGTPLMLQIIVVFYVPGLLFSVPFKSRFLAAFIAFAINYAAYFAEIYRGGIEAMPRGQYEAGRVLGMSRTQINLLVICPQVVKKITPAMTGEIITLVKDTSLANIIGIGEIIFAAKSIVTTKAILWPLFYTGVFYLVMIGALTILFKLVEKKMNYYKA
ncbi:MAG: amino acid ABC transporter permease [Clostridiales bacterium]|nr:amino acid ABC transporter permease [Clostridiales bacterium]